MFTHRHHYTNQRTPLWSKARRFSPPLRWILTFDTRGTRIAWAPRSLTFIRILFAPTNTHCKSFPFQPVSFPIRRRRTSTSNLHVQFIRFKYTRRSYEHKNTSGFSLNAGSYHSTTERWPLSFWFDWTYKELPTHKRRFHKRQVLPTFAFNNQTQATSAATIPFWQWRWNQRKNFCWLPHLLTVHLWVYSAVHARWLSVPMRRLEGI